MNTSSTIYRKQTVFRLNENLLNRLRVSAQKENRSLNNYVESALLSYVSSKPNSVTLEAIDDAVHDRYVGIIDTSSMEAFIKSCEE